MVGLQQIYLGEDGDCDDRAALDAVVLVHYAVAIALEDLPIHSVRAAMVLTDAVEATLDDADGIRVISASDLSAREAEIENRPQLVRCKKLIVELVSILESFPNLSEVEVDEIRQRYEVGQH